MREIKFRAWSLINNPPSMIQITSGLISDLKTIKGQWYVMQFTGLKDKNGKEIYEGDILTEKWRAEVYFKNGSYWVNSNFWENGELFLHGFVGSRNQAKCPVEVIGNIYESPELLE